MVVNLFAIKTKRIKYLGINLPKDQVWGLSLLPLDFSFILPVVSRLLQLCSTCNKNFLVNGEKICYREGPPKRFRELHEEKEREEGARGEQEERKGDSKRKETDLHSTLFSKCSP